MAGYKKVILTERRNSLTATTTKEVATSATDSQLDKFDTDYSNDKLNSIYNEYESIVLNPSKDIMTKKNAMVEVSTTQKLQFKTKVYIVSATIVIALLAFLAVYNIFVINNMNKSIQLVEGSVVQEEANLYEVIKDYNKLNNVAKWEEDLRANGYDLNQTATVKLQVLVPAETTEASETNWFDNFCDFVNQLFGG